MTTRISAINLIKALLVLAVMSVFVASCIQQQARTPVTITASETPVPPAAKVSDSTFVSFSHSVPEHKQFACDSCHKRETGLEIKFAGHEACIGCHLNEFVNLAADGAVSGMCASCHNELQAVPPPVQAFPTKFDEGFNMKFDHAAHERGEGRPPEGCAACHEPAGPGKSIPIGIRAHANCLTCHTPDKEIGACNVCHELAPYSRTPQSRYVFRSAFSHADHGPGQGVSCAECHNVIAGAPQGRQVTSIAAREHLVPPGNNCYSCHNGRRAFDGNDPLNFASCGRCHSGSGFDMLPGSP